MLLREEAGLPKCSKGGHLLPPDGIPLISHLQPLPPRLAEGSIFVASEHLPDTWGDTVPPPLHSSEPPGTSHCPQKPGQAAAFSIPLISP